MREILKVLFYLFLSIFPEMLKEMREALKAMAAPPNMAAASADRNFMGRLPYQTNMGAAKPNQTKMEEPNQINIYKVTEVIPDEAAKLY